ncbi:MAG: ABC transporter substrate-binding protein [Acidobacteriota bacterium]|nr:ABC transporter substrate-binding protein [Acidobacteriota bacterium]MDE3043501.1 ABC transporter substrate-binding protein [Acidobacteriota bacterium]MDE3106820.1 ABC transporter substrate-binding protein [Acidobacteriota bacterium]MDE3222961.1 ABC transporter substrate-binding protein [Acidobacteriota bacterium]
MRRPSDSYTRRVRIVSFLPSATEIVTELGLGAELKGVTIECNWPADVREHREIVVGTFVDPSMSPGEIDATVRARVAAGLDLYELDDEALARCAPDLILTQDLCRVCAVASGDVESAMSRLNCHARVVQLEPKTLDDVLTSIIDIAEAADVRERGDAYVASLRARLVNVAQLVGTRPRRKVFVLEWIDPPFGAGHWVPDVVRCAGGEPVLARAGERSTTVTFDEIAASTPDVVLVTPCGYDLEGCARQAHEVLHQLPEKCEVWAVDADAVMVRPGPRLVEGVEAIAELLHGVGDPRRDLVRRVR